MGESFLPVTVYCARIMWTQAKGNSHLDREAK